MYPHFLPISEAALALGIHRTTIHRIIRRNGFPQAAILPDPIDRRGTLVHLQTVAGYARHYSDPTGLLSALHYSGYRGFAPTGMYHATQRAHRSGMFEWRYKWKPKLRQSI